MGAGSMGAGSMGAGGMGIGCTAGCFIDDAGFDLLELRGFELSGLGGQLSGLGGLLSGLDGQLGGFDKGGSEAAGGSDPGGFDFGTDPIGGASSSSGSAVVGVDLTEVKRLEEAGGNAGIDAAGFSTCGGGRITCGGSDWAGAPGRNEPGG